MKRNRKRLATLERPATPNSSSVNRVVQKPKEQVDPSSELVRQRIAALKKRRVPKAATDKFRYNPEEPLRFKQRREGVE